MPSIPGSIVREDGYLTGISKWEIYEFGFDDRKYLGNPSLISRVAKPHEPLSV